MGGMNMKNYKSLTRVWLESQEKEDKLAIDYLDKFYFDNIIVPYKASDKIIDLHTHTNYSDGDLSPSELIKLAIEKRVGTLAITDHDTLDGIKKIDRSDSLIIDSGIQIINGIELSAKNSKGRMYILGYDIDINDTNLNRRMEELKDNSINSVLSIMEQLKRDYDIVFRYNDIKELVNSKHNLGRIDLAKLCVKYEYASSIQDAFDKYLIEAYNKTRSISKSLSYEECIELILQSGGIPILAHPKSLELSEKEFLILLKEMINIGLNGIEVYHSSHTEEEMKFYLEIANRYNLLISGGSDYHGTSVKPDIELGTGRNNNLKIKSLSLINNINK